MAPQGPRRAHDRPGTAQLRDVHRYDSGWVPIEDGNCQRYAPIATGVVEEYRNIRNIRIAASR